MADSELVDLELMAREVQKSLAKIDTEVLDGKNGLQKNGQQSGRMEKLVFLVEYFTGANSKSDEHANTK